MRNITVTELKARLANGEQLNVIDVREKGEYEEVNINAQLVPLSDLRNFDETAVEPLKDKEIIVHCRSGVRSKEACMILEQMGYTNTVNLEGGIMEWLRMYPNDKL